jgi:hypothetical protein
MNINQKQSILDVLEQILNLDLQKIIIESYAEETDFSKINIGKYSADDFCFKVNKFTTQLKNELENGLGVLLPAAENYSNDYGSVNLQQDLAQLFSYLTTKALPSAEQFLDKLIQYEIKNGFWDKSTAKAHSIDQEALKKQKVLIELNQKALDSNLLAYDGLKKNLETTISELNTLIDEKNQELSQITTLTITATTKLAEINTTVSNATVKETEINGILKNLTEKSESVTESITTNNTDFNTIKSEAKALTDSLTTNLTFADKNLTKAKADIIYIEDKKSMIELLTGMAADGSLGSKFNTRQEDLKSELVLWKSAIPIMTILTGIWVITVFTCLKANFPNEWQNIAVNILKTSPAFILLSFVFSQYKKVRNLQEEYAFKSAVAMTLTAYSEMLAKADDATNVSRQQMLLKSIEMIYNQPQIHPVKSESIFSFNTKPLKETVESLADAVKTIKNV